MSKILIFFIRFYQLLLSPLLGQNCRFQPSCSAYMVEAISRHGSVRGGFMGLRRVLRCHPIKALGGSSGFDPVPPLNEEQFNLTKTEKKE